MRMRGAIPAPLFSEKRAAPVTQPAPYKENVFMNNEYIASVNSGFFYLLVAGVLLFITIIDVYKRQSHRLSSTRFCDRILFLENGRVTETGNHEALMAAKGAYAHMYEVQSHYYKKKAEGRPVV